MYSNGWLSFLQIILAYDTTALLVEIGSCLGLWLGLSVIGIYDLAVMAVLKVSLVLKLQYTGRTKSSPCTKKAGEQDNYHHYIHFSDH